MTDLTAAALKQYALDVHQWEDDDLSGAAEVLRFLATPELPDELVTVAAGYEPRDTQGGGTEDLTGAARPGLQCPR